MEYRRTKELYRYECTQRYVATREKEVTFHEKEVVLTSFESVPPGKWVLVKKLLPPYDQEYVPTDYLKRVGYIGRYEGDLTLDQSKTHFRMSLVDRLAVRGTQEEDREHRSPFEEAVYLYKQKRYLAARNIFKTIPCTKAPCFFNTAICASRMGLYDEAIFYLSAAISTDPTLAVAYFQRANIYMALCDYVQAMVDYSYTLDVMRDRPYIDYNLMGLPFILNKASVLINRAIACGTMAHTKIALSDLQLARTLVQNRIEDDIISTLEKQMKHPKKGFRSSIKLLGDVKRSEKQARSGISATKLPSIVKRPSRDPERPAASLRRLSIKELGIDLSRSTSPHSRSEEYICSSLSVPSATDSQGGESSADPSPDEYANAPPVIASLDLGKITAAPIPKSEERPQTTRRKSSNLTQPSKDLFQNSDADEAGNMNADAIVLKEGEEEQFEFFF